MNPQDSQIHCRVSVAGVTRSQNSDGYAAPVRVDRPPPGEELNTGEVTEAREAVSVIVLREGPDGPEVLLVQRNPASRFMGGAWVFPGGSAKPEDGGLEATGLRELKEEAGLTLEGPDQLVPFSRWITPAEVQIRFDTWFFVARAPNDAEAECDGQECVAVSWLRPAEALEAHARDELMLVFPTIKHLEALAGVDTVEGIIEGAAAGEVVAVQPRVIMRDGAAHVLMPGDPGYNDG